MILRFVRSAGERGLPGLKTVDIYMLTGVCVDSLEESLECFRWAVIADTGEAVLRDRKHCEHLPILPLTTDACCVSICALLVPVLAKSEYPGLLLLAAPYLPPTKIHPR